uniref:Uncharacterized protein TCIL3000_1_390 n=1 Tax=Trypanosoma congolense (strain IL3000) TaxID=1068625 RepID=G0UIT1_TRYCI|nr:unnamed protein product [Trypanosoma congolense IL3000]
MESEKQKNNTQPAKCRGAMCAFTCIPPFRALRRVTRAGAAHKKRTKRRIMEPTIRKLDLHSPRAEQNRFKEQAHARHPLTKIRNMRIAARREPVQACQTCSLLKNECHNSTPTTEHVGICLVKGKFALVTETTKTIEGVTYAHPPWSAARCRGIIRNLG